MQNVLLRQFPLFISFFSVLTFKIFSSWVHLFLVIQIPFIDNATGRYIKNCLGFPPIAIK